MEAGGMGTDDVADADGLEPVPRFHLDESRHPSGGCWPGGRGLATQFGFAANRRPLLIGVA